MAQFNLYRVYYYSAPQYSWDVRVDLYMDGTPAGTLLFMKAGQTIPAKEKPLYVSLNTANGIGAVSTTSEPVGEEEGV
jgi:hypothetical protein